VRHRSDLQGLRAVAVLLVVLDHAGLPVLQGGYVGVDVFFVLSGFLITGLLLRQFRADGRIRLTEFYVRRARRILPAAVLTLVVTDLVAHQLLNVVRAREAVGDSVWAAFFMANVHFARAGSDYFAQGQPPSPVQHFWTLAVEEQFYLVWPVLLAAVLGIAVLRRRLLWLVLAAAAASFAWSVHSTATDAAYAYFSTATRAWELALGAALAIAGRRLPAPAAWAGLACICAAGVAFSSSTAFPGWAALLPTVGAALVIAAAPGGASRLLSLAPFRYVGDRSYAFYLWHWPVLVIAAEYAGHELSGAVRLGLLAGAFGLSILSYAVYENPIRQMRWRPQTGALLWPASAAVVLVVAVPILVSLNARATRISEASAAVRPTQLGQATAVRGSWAPLPAVAAAVAAAKRGAALPSPLTPAPTDLRNDFYAFPAGCAAGRNRTSSTVCHLGASGAAKTIAVIGDSHAQMWMPTILRMARRDGWEVVPFVKVGCIPTKWLHTKDWGCTLWYRWAVGRAAKLHPQVTLIAASWADDPHPTAAVRAVSALIGRVKPFSATTIVVGDSPHQHRNPVDCLLASGSTMRSCTARASLTELHTDASVAATAQQHGVGFIKVTGWFCARASNVAVLCPLVVNRTVSWIDLGHISETYGLELTTPFRSAFRRELFR